ncbi:MAG: amidohydrolase, partial [Chloroflexaceae bacterium]|nr:amidohydrolase [Chloroflexaceae bacterium]
MGVLVWGGYSITEATSQPQPHGAVYVEGNRIVAVGSRETLHEHYPDAEQIGGDNLLLLPAFTNSHDHGRGLGTAALGMPDDVLEIWLLGLGSQPPIDPYLAAAFDGIRLLKSGVGTTAHSHNPRSWDTLESESVATLRGYRD